MAECAAPMVGAPIVAGSAGAAGKLAVLIDNQVGATFPTHGHPEKSAGLIMLSATAVAETAAKSRMGNAEAPEPRMEEAGVTKRQSVGSLDGKSHCGTCSSSIRQIRRKLRQAIPSSMGYPNPSPMDNTSHTRRNTLENNKDSLASERG